MKLTSHSLKRLYNISLEKIRTKGASYYNWKNSPIEKNNKIYYVENGVENEIEIGAALEIMNQKLSSTYSERYVGMLGMLSSLINNGYDIRLVQFADELNVPFDAHKWIVLIVETMPIFHINPADLDTEQISDLVEIHNDNTHESVCWKGTNKIGEFTSLLQGCIYPNLDLVKIAIDNTIK